MDESEFWVHLEFRVCRELRQMRHKSLRSLWCDGFVADGMHGDVRGTWVVGRAWIMGGKACQYAFRLRIGDAGVERPTGDWTSLMPDEASTAWLDIDRDSLQIEIDPFAAIPDDDAPKQCRRRGHLHDEYLRLLHACDEANAYEFPSSFDAEDIESRARAVDASLRGDGVVTEFQSWVYHQDASFGLAIHLPEYIREERSMQTVPMILFSNFGNLASLSFAELLPASLRDAIPELLSEKGFHPIPEDVLERPYDGVMVDEERFCDWGNRYFDWL